MMTKRQNNHKIVDFDISALFEALDSQRVARGLSWAQVAGEMWRMAAYEALNTRRGELQMTWPEVAEVIGCTPNQLTGIRTARYAINMKLAMRIVQWLERPASDFIYQARW
jgi:hypothetical protein